MSKKSRLGLLIVSLGFILFLIGTTPMVAPTTDLGGMSLSPIEESVLSIIPGDGTPDAVDDFYTTDENVPLIIDAATGVLVNDSDPDGDTLASQIVTPPLHGSLDFNIDGSFTYTPEPDWYGIDTFEYE
ncbi:MAG: Ig-like domain-containing protein, partial [Candidatus Thorarchaeota archaeon]